MLWMTVNEPVIGSYIAVFRLELNENTSKILEFEFSADEFVQIFHNGKRVIEGPEKGTPKLYFKQMCKVNLCAGKNTITAQLGAYGEFSSAATMTIKHGFYTSLLGDWQYKIVENIIFSKPYPDWGSVPRIEMFNCDNSILLGEGNNWKNVKYFKDNRELIFSNLPAQTYLLDQNFTKTGNIIKFEKYGCFWSYYKFKGTGTIKIRWMETPYIIDDFSNHTLKGEKGRRDGNFFYANYDILHIKEEFIWHDLQWRAGKYVEIICDNGVEIEEIKFFRTNYPFGKMSLNDMPNDLLPVFQAAKLTLECCSHDIFMDCPYYERLMYIGDIRIEALVSYAAFNEFKLPLHCIKILSTCQKENGEILSRYPAKIEQSIGAFVLNYLMIIYEYLLWSDDVKNTKDLLHSARLTANYIKSCIVDNLLYPEGWNFIDWQWPNRGIPYGCEKTSSIINLLSVIAFDNLAQVESYIGSKKLSKEYSELSKNIYIKTKEAFFSEETGLFADDLEKTFYSEHSQVLATIIDPNLNLIDKMENHKNLTKCGIFFSFYYFEMCYKLNREDLFMKRLEKYQQLMELNLDTLPETFTNTRSDCHAWSSHILYHYIATIQNKRPIPLNKRESVTHSV